MRFWWPRVTFLVPIWYPFGALLLISDYLFGAISWPLRRLGIPKTLLEFHRPSSYSIKFFLFPKLMRVGHDVGKGGGSSRTVRFSSIIRLSNLGQLFGPTGDILCVIFNAFYNWGEGSGRILTACWPRWDRRIKRLSSTNAIFYSLLKSLRVRSSLRCLKKCMRPWIHSLSNILPKRLMRDDFLAQNT